MVGVALEAQVERQPPLKEVQAETQIVMLVAVVVEQVRLVLRLLAQRAATAVMALQIVLLVHLFHTAVAVGADRISWLLAALAEPEVVARVLLAALV